MALVLYDPSSSDSEENATFEDTENRKHESAQKLGIFDVSPQPKRDSRIMEENKDELSSKKPKRIDGKLEKCKPAIKIPIPPLKDFTDEEEKQLEVGINKSTIPKSSGLLSVLPAPKFVPLSNKSFTPNVLLKPAAKSTPKEIPKLLKENSSDEERENDDEDTFDEETWRKVCGRKKTIAIKHVIAEPLNSISSDVIELAPEPKKPYGGLDNAAFKKIVNSTKTKSENIELIEFRDNNDVLLVKSLTDPNYAPKEEIAESVNDTCKRKHHITYLAQKAKENEQELQNQWSQNKFTRKQTQSKYGF